MIWLFFEIKIQNKMFTIFIFNFGKIIYFAIDQSIILDKIDDSNYNYLVDMTYTSFAGLS